MQTGTASVYGADGTIAYNAETAIAAFPETIDTEHRAVVEEFIDGNNELIGFRVTDEREYITLTIVPKGATSDAAKAALKFPSIPSKVVFTGPNDSAAFDIWGDPATAANKEYIYVGGARRTMVRGRAALQLTAFKPKSSSMTVTELVTAIV